MIEVYKTNVNLPSKAKFIMITVCENLPGSDPSHNLEDCDKVLRIEYDTGKFNERDIHEILANHGHSMEVKL